MTSRRNVTITLDLETARWARLEAARRDTSVSKLISQLLREHMDDSHAYESAMRSYLAREARPLKQPGDRYPTRESLHERAGLR